MKKKFEDLTYGERFWFDNDFPNGRGYFMKIAPFSYGQNQDNPLGNAVWLNDAYDCRGLVCHFNDKDKVDVELIAKN